MIRFWYTSIVTFLIFCGYASSVWAVSDELEVKFLDIGQGDSVLIRTPHGRTVLIDGGPGVAILERLGEELSFWQKRLDMVILTHPDLDHLEGLVEVLKRFDVDRVLLTGVAHDSLLYHAFFEQLQQKNIQPTLVSTDQDWMIDEGVYLDVLYPIKSVALQEADNVNDTSVTVRLIYGQTSMFLGGDNEKDAEHELLLTDFDLSADIFKSGHHGSRTSSAPELLQAIGAKRVVIQSGRENPFDHPHLDTILEFDEKGMEWVNTKDMGTITLVSDGKVWK
ncbi:MAG: MBL fold metallo-hydrolase [bacterium]|nr:MBL fold metallo-hydrolase [bacterium]